MSIDEDIFQFASWLTDPICRAHESLRRADVVDALHPSASRVENAVRKFFLWMAVVGFAFLALFTTLPGIALRGVASWWQKEPFLCEKGVGIRLGADRTFTLLSWNLCCVGGGYSITDGGVIPWEDRIDRIAEKIVETDADVNCLYEMIDVKSSLYLKEKLKEKGYRYFYHNIGPQALGVNSGIMVASKFEIREPEFTAFPQETLVDRTKYAMKGVFGGDLVSEGKSFARIYATHLQHSEEPAFPTPEEAEGRRKQMEIIIDKVNRVRDRCIVITGDLNEELAAPPCFVEGDHLETWGGDEFCARLMGKRVSHSLKLDHTFVRGGAVETALIETGFDAARYKKEALTDHKGLLSRIAIQPFGWPLGRAQ